MRLVKRNLKPIWYRLYLGEKTVKGDDDYETGEKKVSYSDPVKLMCNVSPASGNAVQEMFGVIEDYDKIIITDDMNCPIDENTVIYIDKKPKRKVRLQTQFPVNPFGNVLYASDVPEKFDYVVRRVAKSLHNISYAVSKVKVS